MSLDFKGRSPDESQVRVGFIGCGGHAFRNLFPVFPYIPAELVATCDLKADQAELFARQFGAKSFYTDYREMLQKEDIDGVFICTGYGENRWISHPRIAIDCMEAGCHAWSEKPASSSCADVEAVQDAERRTGKFYMCGLKTMFFQANVKAVELMAEEEFGELSVFTACRPMAIPLPDEIKAYQAGRKPVERVWRFLDHICHAASLVLLFGGMPKTMFFQRSRIGGGGIVVFAFETGVVASLALTFGASNNGGIERTMLIGEHGHHIIVDNNIRLEYHRNAVRPEGQRYGNTPSHFTGPADTVTAVWEPECSTGQLFSKPLFFQGYYGEMNEFARAIIENRRPAKCHSEHAWQTTRIFEAFAEGPGKVIEL